MRIDDSLPRRWAPCLLALACGAAACNRYGALPASDAAQPPADAAGAPPDAATARDLALCPAPEIDGVSSLSGPGMGTMLLVAGQPAAADGRRFGVAPEDDHVRFEIHSGHDIRLYDVPAVADPSAGENRVVFVVPEITEIGPGTTGPAQLGISTSACATPGTLWVTVFRP